MKLLLTDLDNVLCNENGLQEDAAAFLRAAHEKLFTIILTNHPTKQTQERINRFGVSQYIDLVISAAEYEMPKPDHRMINVLLALLNTEGKKFDRGDIVLVGDRPSIDIKLANKAGVRAIRVRRGRFLDEEAEYPEEVAKIEVKNLTELAGTMGLEIKKEEPVEITPIVAEEHDDLAGEFDISKEIDAAVKRKKKAKKRAKPAAKKKGRKRRTAKKKSEKRGFFDF